ncbi:MAG: hypothetical protein GY861_05125 [bacterium]|nr:hypothetical protein [bacterium]
MVLGRDLDLPMDVSLQLPNPVNIVDIEDYKLDLMFRLHSAWEIADKCINKAQQKQKYFHNKCVHLPPNYQQGDVVFLYVPAVPKGFTAKLMHLWRPYRVIECKYPNLLVAPLNNPRARPKLVNIDQVKPGPPERKTLSLPCLRLPEITETPQKTDKVSESMEVKRDEIVSTDVPDPPTIPKYNLRLRPHRAVTSSSDLRLIKNCKHRSNLEFVLRQLGLTKQWSPTVYSGLNMFPNMFLNLFPGKFDHSSLRV